MNDLIKINFYGDELLAVTNETDGKTYIPLKRIAENIGYRWDNELVRIKGNMLLNSTILNFSMVADDGKTREMTCLPLDMLNGYLFTIPVTERTNTEVKERLLKYQRECCKILFEYFMPKESASKESSLLSMAKLLVQAVERMESIENRVVAIEMDKQQAVQELESMPLSEDHAKEKTMRKMIGEIINVIGMASGGDYQAVWRKAYHELKLRYEFNADVRSKHSGLSKLDECEKHGMLKPLYDIVSDMAREQSRSKLSLSYTKK